MKTNSTNHPGDIPLGPSGDFLVLEMRARRSGSFVGVSWASFEGSGWLVHWETRDEASSFNQEPEYLVL